MSVAHDLRYWVKPVNAIYNNTENSWTTTVADPGGGGRNLAMASIQSDSLVINLEFDIIRKKCIRIKCTKFDFRWGSTPDAAGGPYSAPQTP